ncbi:serine/threonine-protein kinase [Nocardia aurea]|uniref:non-specific serine/threonine protein kinase n=1 Tax=Nocardia aurea TaxID=2144174 RepID=A0ABV3G5A8_9NOCA
MVLAVGDVFAGFTIEGILGAGGMGVVYAARHPRMNRVVALKVLNDAFATDPRARAGFDREAALAARLDHPNIVAVYDRSGPDDPAVWLAMRRVPGGDANALLTREPRGLAPSLAVELIADAASALDHAHAEGVLHRDVKPANLLIESDSRIGHRALLTDFGIARTLDDTVTLSAISVSFAYAAPERFTRQPADHRCDIYSLGSTLHHLLTGQPPFPRDDQAAVIGAHLSEVPPAPQPPPTRVTYRPRQRHSDSDGEESRSTLSKLRDPRHRRPRGPRHDDTSHKASEHGCENSGGADGSFRRLRIDREPCQRRQPRKHRRERRYVRHRRSIRTPSRTVHTRTQR